MPKKIHYILILISFMITLSFASQSNTDTTDSGVNIIYSKDIEAEQFKKFNSLNQSDLIKLFVENNNKIVGEKENAMITLSKPIPLKNGFVMVKSIDTSIDLAIEKAFNEDIEYVKRTEKSLKDTDTLILCSLYENEYFTIKRNLSIQVLYIHYKTKKELITFTIDKKACEDVLKKQRY